MCTVRAGCGLFSRGRVSARRPRYFSLLRQRNVPKRKATLLAASLRFASGNLRCSRLAGSAQTRFTALRSDSARPFFRQPLRSSAHPEGNPAAQQPTRAIASLGQVCAAQRARAPGAERSNGPPAECPSGCAEERRVRGGQVCRRTHLLRELTRRGCLSAARSAKRVPRRTPHPSTAGCPKRSAGTHPAGSPFLCLLSFGEAKESECAAGRNSRPRNVTNKQSTKISPSPENH